MSRSCRSCCLVKAEEGCQEGARTKEAGWEEEEEKEEKGQRNIRHEIAQKRRRQEEAKASTTGFATAVAASLVISHASGPKDPASPEGTGSSPTTSQTASTTCSAVRGAGASPAWTASRSHFIERARRMSASRSESISAGASSIRRITPSSSS